VTTELGRAGPGGATTNVSAQRWFLAFTLLILNVVDVVMTRVIIGLGGKEANPFMRQVIDRPLAPLALKGMIAVLVGALLLASPKNRRFADVATLAVCVAYLIVVCWNLFVFLRASGRLG